MAAIAQQDASAGAAVTFEAAAAGDTIQAGTKAAKWAWPVVLIVKNGAVSAVTVTVEGHPPVNVPATSGEAVIPVFGGVYLNAVKTVTYSATGSVTVAAVKLYEEA